MAADLHEGNEATPPKLVDVTTAWKSVKMPPLASIDRVVKALHPISQVHLACTLFLAGTPAALLSRERLKTVFRWVALLAPRIRNCLPRPDFLCDAGAPCRAGPVRAPQGAGCVAVCAAAFRACQRQGCAAAGPENCPMHACGGRVGRPQGRLQARRRLHGGWRDRCQGTCHGSQGEPETPPTAAGRRLEDCPRGVSAT